MKRFYFIFPLVLLAVFIVLYLQFSKSADEADRVKAEKQAMVKQAIENKKKEDADKSRQDSEKRTAARLAEERQKEEERIAKWNAESKRIDDETQQYVTKSTELAKEISDLEKHLVELRATKDGRTRELLTVQSEVELAAITKHNAELEIQRMNEMLVRKVAKTSFVKQ
jgi:chromosome segregation ATPase